MREEPAVTLVLPSEGDLGCAEVLNLYAKRTYAFEHDRICVAAKEQVPLVLEPEYHEAAGQGGEAPPRADPDVFCHLKSGTDLVVQGTAHARQGPVPEMEVGVAVGTIGELDQRRPRFRKRLRVVGDRRVLPRGAGQLPEFSAPAPFAEMPVTYDRAYGGRDLWSEATHPDEETDWLARYSEFSREQLSRYTYPRNPSGRGYIVNADERAFEAIALPNVEDPGDLLTPARLCSGDFLLWHRAPVPGGFDWFEQSWFPRIAFIGGCPQYKGAAETLPEVASGLLTPGQVAGDLRPFSPETVSTRFSHGATPGMTLPTFRGDEVLEFEGFHRELASLRIRLSGVEPRMLLEAPGGLEELKPFLRTVVVQVEARRLLLVWVGRLPLEQPLSNARRERLRHAVEWRDR